MNLSHSETLALRELGWTDHPRRSKRPSAIPAQHVLEVGEDVLLHERRDSLLIGLDGAR